MMNLLLYVTLIVVLMNFKLSFAKFDTSNSTKNSGQISKKKNFIRTTHKNGEIEKIISYLNDLQNLTSDCSDQVKYFLNNLKFKTEWTLAVIDSYGMHTTGLING